MEIKSAQEALFVACEMERGAVGLYERALCLMEEKKTDPLYASLRKMLADEKRHLQQFKSLLADLEEPLERQLMLSAIAAGVLFEGGLMGAARQGLLDSVESMLHYASQQEQKAAESYRSFAAQSADEQTKTMLLGIAEDETHHLAEIVQLIKAFSP